MNMYKIYTHYHYSIISYLFNIIFIGCCFHDPRLTIFQIITTRVLNSKKTTFRSFKLIYAKNHNFFHANRVYLSSITSS